MPTTTTQRPPSRSALVSIALVLGFVGLWIGPIGCGGDSDEATPDPAAETVDRSVLLNVGIIDETETRPVPEQFTIESPGGERWRPDLSEVGLVTNDFDSFPVGERHEFYIYPMGDEGAPLAVPFTMQPDMSSALASSRTNIMIHDDSIVVEGPAIPDGKQTFDRDAAEGGS